MMVRPLYQANWPNSVIKILHTADIHLDSPLKSLALRDETLRARVQTATRTAFTRIVDFALAERVSAVLISGDLFDGAERSARTAAFLTGQFDRLRQRDIRVFYIKGNHDAENPITGELAPPDNVHVFDGRGGKQALTDDLWIHGVSFAGRQAPESLLPKFPAPVPGAINIAMLHTSLAGASGHDVYAPCTVAELAAMGFDYWALGHVHKRQIHSRAPWVVMPGMPQGRDIGEAGPKSATLLTIDGAIGVEEIPTSPVEFLTREIDVRDLDTGDAIRDRLRVEFREIAGALRSDAGVVRLTLRGDSPLRWQLLRDPDIWTETAVQSALETGQLWLDRLVLDLDHAEARSQTAIDELAGLMEAIRAEDGFAETTRAELKALLAELPPQRRAALAPDEDAVAALAQRLAADGGQSLVARMKGASE